MSTSPRRPLARTSTKAGLTSAVLVLAAAVVGLIGPTESGAAAPLAVVAAPAEAPQSSLTARLNKTALAIGMAVRVYGISLPAIAGETLKLERLTGGVWDEVAETNTAATGAYEFWFRRPEAGKFSYRVVRPATDVTPAEIRRLPALEVYRVHTYTVQTKGAVTADLEEFRRVAAATLNDPRGWTRSYRRFREVTTGGDFSLVMAEAKLVPSFSSMCSVRWSCRVGRNVVMNEDRWLLNSQYFSGPLSQYREMVVNHEVGHWLGAGHQYCKTAGAPAPVMMQQSKGTLSCTPNAWPLTAEIVARR